MIGADLSHFQGKIDWNKLKSTNIKFVIQKCTQGVNFIDQTYKTNKVGARKVGILFSSYHFAQGLNAIKEADWFLKNVGDIQEGEFLVLDWEINHLDPANWCREFLDRVFEKTGIRPILYTNEARVKAIDWTPVVNGNFGLWVARYYLNTGYKPPLVSPFSGKWPSWAIWQYTSRGKVSGISGNVDMNYTSMSIDTLKKYGKQETTIETPPVTEEPALPENLIESYTVYSQRDLRWAWKKLGNSNLTIYNWGCFLCCLAMIVGKRPDEVNEILKSAGAFNGANIISDKAAKALGLAYFGKDSNINSMPQWSPSIKEVDYNKLLGGVQQHFVLRIIKDDGSRAIIDPLGGVERTINYYPAFVSYRLFRK